VQGRHPIRQPSAASAAGDVTVTYNGKQVIQTKAGS
jgi:hypothetical protein